MVKGLRHLNDCDVFVNGSALCLAAELRMHRLGVSMFVCDIYSVAFGALSLKRILCFKQLLHLMLLGHAFAYPTTGLNVNTSRNTSAKSSRLPFW